MKAASFSSGVPSYHLHLVGKPSKIGISGNVILFVAGRWVPEYNDAENVQMLPRVVACCECINIVFDSFTADRSIQSLGDRQPQLNLFKGQQPVAGVNELSEPVVRMAKAFLI
jgi:hypothetical protein